MFGFGLKDKAKKILENDIGIRRPTQSWLNHIVKQGKPQDFNEYDVVINYCMTEWEYSIDRAMRSDDKELKILSHKMIHSERDSLRKIEHLAHPDLDYRERVNQIIKKSKELIK
jgi:hypothetical protein|tara:strand:- start:2389 stop:2730 length:342 start_codon:yes stop_codon:yes gene_type:complete